MSASNNARRRDPQARHQTGATMQRAFLGRFSAPGGYQSLRLDHASHGASEIRQVLAALDRAAEDR